jgi:[ribosomal protein S18]-alanine N-acetyltransferase
VSVAPSIVSLRPATEDDVVLLVHVARLSWLSAFEGSAPPAFIARWRAKDSEPAWYARYWPDMTVADLDGKPCGLVQPVRDEVNGLWVVPDAQGKGVGSALLLEAERHIASAGYDRAWLTCSGFNPRALEFYLRRGYCETRRQSEELEPGLVDNTIVLERSLTAVAINL